ncbi:NAD(P) transhydrogenase subunit alpha [Marinobacterium rhizophilum]|uniref:proton-translocating NAD(P)(+) transhydrogenase n=1 Tax=Marinobacterium rhizophilum TaxID=420402 RepID=A0ABY5HE92_9GAMM|nr:NAD(P) transhydrogenase subunit alpha [Marinobacterium rhizophilum]UTW10181.1 NAD(P) transhydrogenase subunit alpha [Marinobacterium rhizophilum]
MKLSVLKDLYPGERRVALTPANVAALCARGCDIRVEAGAGEQAGFADELYIESGADIVMTRSEALAGSEVLLCVNASRNEDLDGFCAGQLCIALMDPLSDSARFKALAERGLSLLALELVPRISRAQSMDVLSSIATIAGYKAVLLAAEAAPRIFPMMMTAAGTLNPARVFVMGAGVAGLQAAATARRLGAVVEAYDVRAAAREQIISVGARPIELDLPTAAAEGQGGYAAAQDADFLTRQREQMTAVLAQQDIVITTAAIPGSQAPVLISAGMVAAMKPGAVIVDLAAERGGNCELTRAGETRQVEGVTIMGPLNLAATVPMHASQMHGRNIENLLLHLLNADARLQLDFDDEIVADTLVSHQGEICAPRVRERLGLGERALKEVA